MVLAESGFNGVACIRYVIVAAKIQRINGSRNTPQQKTFRESQLVATEEVAGVDFLLDIVEDGVVTVGDDGVTPLLEGGEVVNDKTAEEGATVGKGGLIDNNLRALGLDTFHDALNTALTEVVGVGLHGQAEDTDGGN